MIKITDLEVFKGDSQDIVITIKDSGTAIDITGYTFFFTVKENKTDTDADAKIDKTVTSLSDPTNGEVTIAVSKTDTTLPVSTSTQKYVYDVRMQDTSGKITTILLGNYKIKEPVRITTS